MLSQIQRFGGAMFTPVLLFPFAGIVVGLAILLQNPMFVGESLTDPNSLFAQIVHIIEEGGCANWMKKSRCATALLVRKLADPAE